MGGRIETPETSTKVGWFPKLTNRQKCDAWMAAGGRDMRRRANDRARTILDEHQPRHLDEGVERELDRMARAAQQAAVDAARRGSES